MPWKWLESARREMAREKAMRSRWEDGVREAARQMSRMRSGFFSDLRRARAARDFCLEVSGVLESGFRMEEEEKGRRWSVGRRSLEREAMVDRERERERN